MLFGVPTLYDALLKAKGMDKIDFSFLKYAVSGGDTLPEKLEKNVNDFLAAHNCKTKICEGYGMTEGLAALSLSVAENYKSRTIGKPLLGTEMCIVEPGTVNVLPADTDGELCVSGPTIMIGYRNNPEETANTLRTHADGKTWLHTGDMGYMRDEEMLYVVGRFKSLLIALMFTPLKLKVLSNSLILLKNVLLFRFHISIKKKLQRLISF